MSNLKEDLDTVKQEKEALLHKQNRLEDQLKSHDQKINLIHQQIKKDKQEFDKWIKEKSQCLKKLKERH